jgi:hypothetical protein
MDDGSFYESKTVEQAAKLAQLVLFGLVWSRVATHGRQYQRERNLKPSSAPK